MQNLCKICSHVKLMGNPKLHAVNPKFTHFAHTLI